MTDTSEGDRRGKLMVAGVATIAFALGAAFLAWISTRPRTGPDNCVYEDAQLQRRAPVDQLVVLVDQSEVFSANQVKHSMDYVTSFVSDAVLFPPRSRVLVFAFTDQSFQRLSPLVALCSLPAKGNDVYENNRFISARFASRFLLPLGEHLKAAVENTPGTRSPILEALQLLSYSRYIDDAPGRRKHLIVVSDLLQNSEASNHYTGSGSYSDGGPGAFRPDLAGWQVTALYVSRYKNRNLQTPAHIDFWQRVFAQGGAIVREVVRIVD